ncbi:14-3-3 protein gamma [Euphorbia peplus]|nr:14-3-3 protein gamma [Euphorbia peplus]
MAKLAQKFKLVKDMVKYMKQVVQTIPITEDLTEEHRNLLSVAYKIAIANRCATWRKMSTLELREICKANLENVAAIETYKAKVLDVYDEYNRELLTISYDR